jgi:ATP-binding cassette subfamily F protein 3
VLTVNQVAKRFGDTLILDHVSFVLNPGERVGLVGPNGAGKSTLLRIVAGELTADAGSVSLPPGRRLGHLRQGFADTPHGTLADLLDGPTGGLVSSHEVLEAVIARYGDPDANLEVVAAEHERATERFEAAGGYPVLDELGALLDRFGLGGISHDRSLRELSGGQKTRAGLAALLVSRPDVLILDEPTNHLDIDAQDWLVAFIREYTGAVLMVSHDRGFLDQVVTRIIEIDPDTHGVASYVGTFTDYAAAKRQEEQEQAEAYARQQAYIGRITEDIRGAEHHARTIEANTIDFAVRAKAAKIARPAVVRKRKLERLMESTEYVEKPKLSWGLSVDLGTPQPSGRDVVMIEDATLGYPGVPVLHNVSLHIGHGERVAITGPNGGGKSTLVRTIMGNIPPLAGSVRLGANVTCGYFAQEQDTLDSRLTVLEQARKAGGGSESDMRTYLHKYLFGGEMVHRRIADISYGERARLMLAILVLKGTNLLLLDEPLNHLDISAREEFEQALGQFQGTMLLVLHDRYAIERLASRTIEVRDGAVREVIGQLAR